MDTSRLEQRIEERAEERFNKEYNELVKYLINHPIGKGLTIRTTGVSIPLADFGSNNGLLTRDLLANTNTIFTNLASLKSRLMVQYKNEETDSILSKLDKLDSLETV